MKAAVLAALLAVAPVAGWAEGLLDSDGPEPQHDVPGAFDEVSAVFSERLNRLHPPGSPVAELRAALEAEGFAPEGDTAARLERPGFLCDMGWVVRWTEEAGAVATIEGERYGVCL